MARAISTANATALAAHRLAPRDFLWIVARNRTTGDPETVGFWSDVGNYSFPVVDPDTGLDVTRAYYGSGTLIQISSIPLVSSLTVQTVTVDMSQIDSMVEQAVRDYDCKQARIEIHRGLFDPDTRQMVDAAECRFVGFVDDIEIITGAEDEEGSVTLTCVSHTQEFFRYNPDTRSDESQKTRDATDTFFVDVGVVGDWPQKWGATDGTVQTQPAQKQGIFGWGNFLGFL